MVARFIGGSPSGSPREDERGGAGLAHVGEAPLAPRIDEIRRRPLFSLQGYSGLQRSCGDVYFPASVEELRVLFRMARRTGRRVTFRAGGQSFDGQALNDDIVISMHHFRSIEIDTQGARMTVGAGATWGAIARELAARGFVPYTVVSTSHATAGGTVSGDCLSRFSGIASKEGHYVERLSLLRLDGQLLSLSRDDATSALFHAVIGGLGYLGAVIDVTYRIARVAPAGTPIRVVTQATRCTSLEELATALLPRPEQLLQSEGGTAVEDGWIPEALFSIAFHTLDGSKGMVLRSRYVPGTSHELRPLLIHRPRHVLRVPIEWLMRASVVSRGLWTLIDRFLFDVSRPYVDELMGYLFFMDGNVRAKRIAQTFGMPMLTVQQAFMIPYDPSAPEDSLRRLVDFLGKVDEIATRDGIPPLLLDVLHIQGDQFLLSANHGTDGFAVTLAFEVSEEESAHRLRLRLSELSARALELGGRVYLVKNVHATAEHLHAMYAHALPEFVRLKRLVDPDGLLRNEFLERVFPAHFGPAPRPPSP
ncbi:FAD-binding oxidoreductase [Sorangium sp. So ce124]|uniref:FAD-binding oxidoreductase n=1 Tax=Sorangium sp. So ce124 TaxID=3133280 RepID=UPI003F6396A0